MFIQTEATPNPATLKFMPGKAVMGEQPPADFPNAEAAKASPLASALFALEHVTGVFFGADFITVTKDNAEWQHIKPAILTTIMDHFVAGLPVMHTQDVETAAQEDEAGPDAEIIGAIKQLLDTRVRPPLRKMAAILFSRLSGRCGIATYARCLCRLPQRDGHAQARY